MMRSNFCAAGWERRRAGGADEALGRSVGGSLEASGGRRAQLDVPR